MTRSRLEEIRPAAKKKPARGHQSAPERARPCCRSWRSEARGEAPGPPGSDQTAAQRRFTHREELHMTRTQENAHRLAAALERHAADPRTVERLAAILDYLPEQLREDIDALAVMLEEQRPQE